MKKILFVTVLVLLGMVACGTPRQELDRLERELDGLVQELLDSLQGGIESRGNDDDNDSGNNDTAATLPTPTEVEIGQLIEFGGYEWRVLDIDGNYAKLLTENIIFNRVYHDIQEEITWATSDIRAYLNETFFYSFSETDRAKIRQTAVINSDNQWFGTSGGANTTDRIFLLSIEEVVRYFGDSGQLENRPGDFWAIVDDDYNNARIARNAEGTASWWWLRSPGTNSAAAAIVNAHGILSVDGRFVPWVGGDVRPALWLNLAYLA